MSAARMCQWGIYSVIHWLATGQTSPPTLVFNQANGRKIHRGRMRRRMVIVHGAIEI